MLAAEVAPTTRTFECTPLIVFLRPSIIVVLHSRIRPRTGSNLKIGEHLMEIVGSFAALGISALAILLLLIHSGCEARYLPALGSTLAPALGPAVGPAVGQGRSSLSSGRPSSSWTYGVLFWGVDMIAIACKFLGHRRMYGMLYRSAMTSRIPPNFLGLRISAASLSPPATPLLISIPKSSRPARPSLTIQQKTRLNPNSFPQAVAAQRFHNARFIRDTQAV
jgi:hypothetical protein